MTVLAPDYKQGSVREFNKVPTGKQYMCCEASVFWVQTEGKKRVMDAPS